MLHTDLIAPIPDLLRRHAAARGGKCAYRDANTAVTYAALLERVAKNAPGDSFGLTEHERQCLHWTARGKTTWETAKILKRSTATINFHLRKACRKLGAANKCEAASRAVYHGLLAL